MRLQTASILSANGPLATAAGFLLFLPENIGFSTARAVGPYPEGIHLVGMVRDFRETHPDFQVVPSNGVGHYAGLVAESLGADGKPVFDGPGNKVNEQATDSLGRNIPPHLAEAWCGMPMPSIAVSGTITGSNIVKFDSYDSAVGPYGGANVMDSGVMTSNSTDAGAITLKNSSHHDGHIMSAAGGDETSIVDVQDDSTCSGVLDEMPDPFVMPPLPAMTGSPFEDPSTGNLIVPRGTVRVINTDMHLDQLVIRKDAQVRINGEVTILCEDVVQAFDDTVLSIPAGSSLRLFCRSGIQMVRGAKMHPDTSEPSRLQIFMLGADMIELNNNGTSLCANVLAPDGTMQLEQSSEFYGTFIGRNLIVSNTSKFHMDLHPFVGAWGPIDVGDTPAVLHPSGSNGGITSAVSFGEWFNEVPSANKATPLLITLIDQEDGTWVYDDALDPRYGILGGLHPIDDRLLGNEGLSHNHHFTYHFTTRFTYDETAEQHFTVAADADVWVYVDDDLAIDLGGVKVNGKQQRLDMSRLCLTDGQVYKLLFFMAERNRVRSRIRIETNIEFRSALLPGADHSFD